MKEIFESNNFHHLHHLGFENTEDYTLPKTHKTLGLVDLSS